MVMACHASHDYSSQGSLNVVYRVLLHIRTGGFAAKMHTPVQKWLKILNSRLT